MSDSHQVSTANYRVRLRDAIDSIDLSEVDSIIDVLKEVRDNYRTVFVLGNGGSQANAAHLVLHLRDVGIKAFDLLSETPWLTAFSNDVVYEHAPRAALSLLRGHDDLLFVISGSGNSKNLVMAAAGMKTVGLLGFGGGEAMPLCTEAVVLPQTEYGVVEDCHSVVIHMIHEVLE